MDKRFVLILVGIIVVLGSVFWFTRSKSTAPGSSSSTSTASVSNHTEGKGSTGVTLREFGDFQCPACGQYYPIVKQIVNEYNDKITFQFSNFPLVQIHQNAMSSARAAEAAGLQGKYWEMHDLLYQQQSMWSSSSSATSIFNQYAAQLGLNVEKFKTDYASPAVLNTINADIKAAQQIGATGTPTFVLDGKKIDTPPTTIEGFRKVLDDAIAAKSN